MPYTDIRVRHVRSGHGRPGGDYVLYWMQAYRRLESNHALDEALRRADEAGKPVVYEGLRLDYPWASVRHHRFILEGMQANREAATRLGLAYWPFVEPERGAGRGLMARLAERATLVVTDDFPCFVVPDQTEALARRATVPVIAVDGNTIVPLARLHGQGPAVTGAAHLRPRIHRDFADAWEHRASAEPRVPRVARSSLSPPFPPADLGDVDSLLARLPVDRSVPAVARMPGGSVAAGRQLEEFLTRRLAGYAESRSEPAPPEASRQSGLSPYLHFGHISIETVVERALSTTDRWTPMNLEPRMAGRAGARASTRGTPMSAPSSMRPSRGGILAITGTGRAGRTRRASSVPCPRGRSRRWPSTQMTSASTSTRRRSGRRGRPTIRCGTRHSGSSWPPVPSTTTCACCGARK